MDTKADTGITPRMILGATLLSALLLAGCASTSPAYHQIVMQGQILSVASDTLVVCIGERDGAKVGQELAVVRHVPQPAASKAAGPGFRRAPVGQVRITTVFDDHYASARIISGRPQVNDVVELENK
ncbi:MAG: hypothetical protein WC213_06110 [Arenimonas sp.]